MDPQTCTIILLKQTNPFYIPDNGDEDQDMTITLLETVFGHVHKESNLESCLNYTKLLPSSSTLLLFQLDETTAMNDQVKLISQTVDKLSETVPVIVCSTRDDPNFMLECIQAGASDYLLRPLRPDVIKTLFLTLHRYHTKGIVTESSLSQDHLVSSSTISTVTSVISPITPTTVPPHSAYLPDRIGDRIKALNDKNINFSKAMMETYTPLTSNILPTYKQLSSQERKSLEKRVSTWDFSPINLPHDDLIHCAVIILSQTFSSSEVKEFTQEQLYDFIIDLSSIYHGENPYHNFAHAVDVLQCIYFFLCQMGLLPYADGTPRAAPSKPYRILRPRDIFALLIAAIGHDTAHPGVNNSFLINTSAPLALLYNDISVLENFHAMTLFQLLKKHKFDDMLGGSDSTEYSEFRKLVITSILATDMALHSDYVTKINEQNQRLEESDPNDWTPARCLEERLLFCSGLIKCADISNVARPFPRAFEWAQILIEEFASQGDLERELGMPVLPMNDRSKIILEDSQIGFIKFVALNLFQSISIYMQELSFPVDYIKSNLSIWEDRKRENAEHLTTTEDTEQSTTTTVIDSRQHDDDIDDEKDDSTTTVEENYHVQAAHTLSSKKELEDSGYKLPKMPAVAMTSLAQTVNNNNIYPISTPQYKDTDAQLQRDYDHGDWDPRESSGPVYCHCTIQ